MRLPRVATALVALTAGAAAVVVARRLGARRRAAAVRPAPVTAPVVVPVVASAPDADAVVLPFARRPAATPAVARPAAPARCGDTGGRTKAGAPCAARGTVGGRCHHHRLAA